MIIGKSRCLPAKTDMATMHHGEEEAVLEIEDAEIRHEERPAHQVRLAQEADRRNRRVSLRERVGFHRRQSRDESDMV